MIRIVALISFLTLNTVYAQVGINTETPDPSAALEINSTEKGLLIPRMTMIQKDSIMLIIITKFLLIMTKGFL